MSNVNESRRSLLKASALATTACALGGLGSEVRAEQTAAGIKVAGYDYDRVKGIMDGRAGIDGYDVRFHYEDI